MNENAYTSPFVKDIVLAWTLENKDLKKAISATSIDLIAYHLDSDLEPNMPDARAISHAYTRFSFLQLNFALFCEYIRVKNRLYTFK